MSRPAGTGWVFAGVLAMLVLLAALAWRGPGPATASRAAPLPQVDAFGLPPLVQSDGVVLDAPRVALGRQLFFDRHLSFNGTMSCAMCHVPEEGFASNASKTGVGIEGRSLKRNAPSLLNVAWQSTLFHDGRESSLVSQAWSPLLHPDEMANPSVSHVLQTIRSRPEYRGRFEQAFNGAAASMDTVGAALAAYHASLVSANSRFDQWRFSGHKNALSAQEQRGFAVFSGKANCVACHTVNDRHALLSDGRFHVTGAGASSIAGGVYLVPLAPGVQTVFTDLDLKSFGTETAPDLGRFDITHNADDRYAFKTPSLRNVAHSAPYMHDGSLDSLQAVVDFYDRGGGEVAGKSPLLKPLALSEADKAALIAFLRSLDGANLAELAARSRPPMLTP